MKQKNTEKQKDYSSIVLILVIGALLIFSAVQAAEIKTLKEEIQTTLEAINTNPPSPDAGNTPAGPAMVGGC